MRILVSGSEGFVGIVLVANLLASGYEIDGIDRAKAVNPSYKLHRIDRKTKSNLTQLHMMLLFTARLKEIGIYLIRNSMR